MFLTGMRSIPDTARSKRSTEELEQALVAGCAIPNYPHMISNFIATRWHPWTLWYLPPTKLLSMAGEEQGGN